jgi:ribose transport system permease protein
MSSSSASVTSSGETARLKSGLEKLRGFAPLITLAALVAFVGAVDPSFLQPETLLRMAGDVSALFIMALGLTFVIYIGSIDLSSQALANMATVITAVALVAWGPFAALAALLAGLAFGALSGWVTACLKVPSFVSTLAVAGMALSLAEFIAGERSHTMDPALREAYFGWILGSVGPVPSELILAIALLLAALFLERRTVLGRAFKAIGAGEEAAAASGVQVARIKIVAFALSGLCAAIAGVLFSAKLAGGSPTMAEGFLLPAIVAVLIGGTSLSGGVGGVLNTAIGVLIVAVARSSMLFLDIPATQQQVVFGIILIIAIALSIDRSKLGTVK